MAIFWTAAGVVVAIFLLVASRFFMLWLQAYSTGARVSLLQLMLMPLRKVNPSVIVQCKVMAAQAGLASISTNVMEAQFLAGGDVRKVTLALIAANRAQIPLDWNTAAAIDLAGRDILQAVNVTVNPIVIDCPDPAAGRGDTLNAVAKDGVQLNVRIRVTVRTNVLQLIGGATASTVVARIGEAIVSAIGSCNSYREPLADPRLITRRAMQNGLDAQTAYTIVSVDIADISVGENVGARIMLDQAQADIRIARAVAEERRAMAVARHQEMLALIEERRADLVLAEAQIPSAIAGAIRAGQLGERFLNRPKMGSRRTTTADIGSNQLGDRRLSRR